MSKTRKLGAILSAAAALAFVTAPVTSSIAQADWHHKKACYGVNSCKGKSMCKTASSACKGKNDCKGKGMMKMSEKECKKKGGSLTE